MQIKRNDQLVFPHRILSNYKSVLMPNRVIGMTRKMLIKIIAATLAFSSILSDSACLQQIRNFEHTIQE